MGVVNMAALLQGTEMADQVQIQLVQDHSKTSSIFLRHSCPTILPPGVFQKFQKNRRTPSLKVVQLNSWIPVLNHLTVPRQGPHVKAPPPQ